MKISKKTYGIVAGVVLAMILQLFVKPFSYEGCDTTDQTAKVVGTVYRLGAFLVTAILLVISYLIVHVLNKFKREGTEKKQEKIKARSRTCSLDLGMFKNKSRRIERFKLFVLTCVKGMLTAFVQPGVWIIIAAFTFMIATAFFNSKFTSWLCLSSDHGQVTLAAITCATFITAFPILIELVLNKLEAPSKLSKLFDRYLTESQVAEFQYVTEMAMCNIAKAFVQEVSKQTFAEIRSHESYYTCNVLVYGRMLYVSADYVDNNQVVLNFSGLGNCDFNFSISFERRARLIDFKEAMQANMSKIVEETMKFYEQHKVVMEDNNSEDSADQIDDDDEESSLDSIANRLNKLIKEDKDGFKSFLASDLCASPSTKLEIGGDSVFHLLNFIIDACGENKLEAEYDGDPVRVVKVSEQE